MKRGLCKDIKNSIPMCQKRKYKNTKYKYTKIHKIHKYINTAYDELPERPNMWYIFEERIVQGCQKLYSHVSSTNTQIHKYINTQIHKYSI